MDLKNWVTSVKIENKQKKKTNWKYFKFVKALLNWNYHNIFVLRARACVCERERAGNK